MRTRYERICRYLGLSTIEAGIFIMITIILFAAMIRGRTIAAPEPLTIRLEIPPNTDVLPATSMCHLYPPDARRTWLSKDEYMKFAFSLPETEIAFLRYYKDKTGPAEKFTLYYWAPLEDGTIYYTELNFPLHWSSKFEIDRVIQIGEMLYVTPRYAGVLSELRSLI